jgi:hypothetical protein
MSGSTQARRRGVILATVLPSAAVLTAFVLTVPSGVAAPAGDCT